MLELNEFIVAPGDQFLLCSDGLTDMVADEPLAHLMTADNHLPTKATALVDAANASGGRDNISVLLAKASPPEKKKSLFARLMSAKL
jgi:PPM family protein phosphatase